MTFCVSCASLWLENQLDPSILGKAFRVVLVRQDPNDEPAKKTSKLSATNGNVGTRIEL